MKKILAQNNFHLLTSFNLNDTEILYAPKYLSQLQKSFYQKRFEELKKFTSNVTWTEAISHDDFDHALAWDALFEKAAFQKKLDSRQNRLFKNLPFQLPKSFTPFKELALQHLPSQFLEASTPWDGDIQKELHYYFDEMKLPLTYLETRNEMTGRDGSTKFSTYLSSGFLDVKYLYNKIKDFENLHGETKSTFWIIFELLWREFFYWHYQNYPRNYFSKTGLRGLDFSSFHFFDISQLKSFKAHPFFHAALNELTQTGYLSNRARQLFASLWINDLNLDWRAGAELFETYLIDYDVYSNYGNWMYLAGVGVDPRGKRYFNIEKQLETYDPQSVYLKTWA